MKGWKRATSIYRALVLSLFLEKSYLDATVQQQNALYEISKNVVSLIKTWRFETSKEAFSKLFKKIKINL